MSKKLNEDAVINELRGQSAFFRQPTPPPAVSPPAAAPPLPAEPVVTYSHAAAPSTLPAVSTSNAPAKQTADTPERPNGRTGERAYESTPVRSYGRIHERVNERTPVREYAHTPERPNARTDERRAITRYSFEFYLDQIATLKKLSLEAQMRGEKGSMSEMVREAVDTYIEQRRNRDKT